ncbi:MAG: Rne/Rng family ribonuclease [Verrucomicrobia bacterium]|nr:Rne/Rng family ribonuclease [Verrucomicrobiota bacterium]MCG2679626.1 Rne/Rng family ribonuclease [Kiritimatiellia bacterium]MBU4248175.1 Rne/Rng family ribonuclease [Verrucomicrobiota bacterium]MBU4289685.1 Rne/Rng family ribonuclease [Verrucomicrobiota bacterium]MBU4429014.1 Rne/Rng family ribonuclease [Verrucomicrobiota bacterium]
MFGFRRKKDENRKEIIINVESLETRVAIRENGELEDFKVELPSEERIVGGVYKGKVQNLEDGLQAAFVDIGMRKNAFIHYWDMFPEDLSRLEALEGEHIRSVSRRRQFTREEIGRHFPVGSDIVVQISKGPIGTKGPRATASLSVPSRYFVLMPGSKLRGISRKIEDEPERKRLKKILSRLPVPEGCGLILRTAGAGASGSNFVRDIRSLLDTWDVIQQGIRDKQAPCCLYQEPDLVERTVRDSVTEDIDSIIIDAPAEYERIKDILAKISRRVRSRVKLYDGAKPIFEHYDVDRHLENAFRRKVMLKSGGCIVFDETEAMIAVDVNTGQHKGASSQDEAILHVNTEAVHEIARHLRLRNIGGLIVIDLIDMRHKKHRNMVYQALKDALKMDKARTNILPISSLGLLEMTRQRVDESLEATMYVDCPYCSGRGCVKSPLNMSVQIQRRLLAIMRSHQQETRDGLSLRITVNPTILNRLREEDEGLLLKMQEQFKGRLTFRADPAQHVEVISIVNADTGADLYSNVGGR